MADFVIRNEDYADRVRRSFARQGFMVSLGASLTDVEPGRVEIVVPFSDNLAQQHGYFHGGVVGTLADNAGGYASFSLMAASDSVLTVEYKLNLMAPAEGERLIARGAVIRAGRRLTVSRSDVFVQRNGAEYLCATMLGTFMTLANTSDDPARQTPSTSG
ncbi:MAG: PaaI family thioesterase [Actinobacteria bacterium]|nr:PaaI family thioesterase [Actinomycetota bacterium]